MAEIVAVTACPTGIAHCQMAAESLATAATAMGHEITVEVRGSLGVQNELTTEEIAAADVAVVTADVAVPRERFEELPVVDRPVTDGVTDAEAVIDEAASLAATGQPTGRKREGPERHTSSSTESTDEPRRDTTKDAGLFARLKRLFS